MDYEKVKEILLSKGIFVLDKRKPVEEIKYLINCGYKILYAKYSFYYSKYCGMCFYYVPVVVNYEVIKHSNDKELYEEFKKISYNPKTIIEWFKRITV